MTRHEASQDLSPRQLEVIQAVANGKMDKQIAADLGLSVETVKRHLRNLGFKLDTQGRTAAVAEAFRRGLIT